MPRAIEIGALADLDVLLLAKSIENPKQISMARKSMPPAALELSNVDPITGLYLTGLAGYWIFRGLKSLGAQQPTSGVASPPRPNPITPLSPQTTSSQTPLPTKPYVAPRAVELPRPKYYSAAALFDAEYVSYSRLRYYAECPHKFRLAYLEGNREVSSDRFTGDGSRFHEQCASFFGSRAGQTIGTLREQGNRVVADSRISFVLSSMPSRTKVIASEHKLRFTLRNTSYYGIVDLIGEDDDGVTRLVDFKTGKDPKPHLEQLELYCLPALLGSAQAVVRCSFILVDAREVITWEVGPHNRNEVIGNLIRRVNHIKADSTFAPFISSKCKDCGLAHACHHRRQSASGSRPSETLTSAKRGSEARKRMAEETKQKREAKPPRRPNNSGSFFAVCGKASWVCDETGEQIQPGELHYTTRKGHRLSANGFRRRFPGVSFPPERQRRD